MVFAYHKESDPQIMRKGLHSCLLSFYLLDYFLFAAVLPIFLEVILVAILRSVVSIHFASMISEAHTAYSIGYGHL